MSRAAAWPIDKIASHSRRTDFPAGVGRILIMCGSGPPDEEKSILPPMLQEAILPALNSPTATAPCGRAGNFNHRFVYDSTKERDAKPGNTSTRSAFAELGRSHFGGGIDVSIYRVTLRDRETKTVVGYYNGAWTTDQRRALALRKRESAAAHAAARLLSAQR